MAAQNADGGGLTYRCLFADGLSATNAVATNRIPSGFANNVVSVMVSDGHGGSATNSFSSSAQNDPTMWFGKVDKPLAPDNWTRGHKRALIMTLAFPDFTPVITSRVIASSMLSLSNSFTECPLGPFWFEAVITPVLMRSQPATHYAAMNGPLTASPATAQPPRTFPRAAGLNEYAYVD